MRRNSTRPRQGKLFDNFTLHISRPELRPVKTKEKQDQKFNLVPAYFCVLNVEESLGSDMFVCQIQAARFVISSPFLSAVVTVYSAVPQFARHHRSAPG